MSEYNEENIEELIRKIKNKEEVDKKKILDIIKSLTALIQTQSKEIEFLEEQLAIRTSYDEAKKELRSAVRIGIKSMAPVKEINLEEQLLSLQKLRSQIESHANFVDNMTSITKYAFKIYDLLS